MATFTITVQDTAGDPALAATFPISDTFLQDFLTAFGAMYLPYGTLVTPATVNPPAPAVYRPATPQEILQAATTGIGQSAAANIHSWLLQQAQAAISVPPVI